MSVFDVGNNIWSLSFHHRNKKVDKCIKNKNHNNNAKNRANKSMVFLLILYLDANWLSKTIHFKETIFKTSANFFKNRSNHLNIVFENGKYYFNKFVVKFN